MDVFMCFSYQKIGTVTVTEFVNGPFNRSLYAFERKQKKKLGEKKYLRKVISPQKKKAKEMESHQTTREEQTKSRLIIRLW